MFVAHPPEIITNPFKPASMKYRVQGRRASNYEYYVALALERLDLEYAFQVNMMGGRKLKGGFVVDFFVMTVPKPTPVWVHGEYWHKGKQRQIDALQQAMLRHVLKGRINIPVILFGEDLQTEEKAYVKVKRELHV